MVMGRVLLVAAALTFGSNAAVAATLDISGGELVGAFNVDVGGTLYDVTFVDSSPQTPFAFTTLADATAASQARRT